MEAILAVTVVGIAIILIIRDSIRNKRHQQIKTVVKTAFAQNYAGAWQTFVPSEQEIGTWMNQYQSAEAQANTSQMICDQAFAAGGQGFLASYGQIDAAFKSSQLQKRRLILFKLLHQCRRVMGLMEIHQFAGGCTDEFIEAVVELTSIKQEAIRTGALPPLLL